MGIDVISWHGCKLQTQMTPEEFLEVMKLAAYRRFAEESAPDQLDDLTLRLTSEGGEEQIIRYVELARSLDEIMEHAGDCRGCFTDEMPCYCRISYPVDELAERLLFEYFVQELNTTDSPGDQIYRDVVLAHASQASPFDDPTVRSGDILRASLPRYAGAELRSNRLFDTLFTDVRGLPAVTAHALFWRGFHDFLPQTLRERSDSLSQLMVLPQLFNLTFRAGAAGSSICDVLFFQ